MKGTILCIVLALMVARSFGQAGSILEKTTDSILKVWDTPDKPGMAVGILKNGETLYLKGFGLANLETHTPITTDTKFHLDELSKQFTVLAFLLLEEQGKIVLEENIATYIPELPEYAKNIKLKHVLNHCTGLWDYSITRALIGDRPNDVFTHAEALNLIAAQPEPSFVPGTRFSSRTSDTEITLMTAIIEKASGQTLADFTANFIFKPLGMDNTMFSDDYEMMIPNLAESYQATETGFKKRVLNNANAGPTNLYTSAQDLAIWYAQYSKPKTGLAALVQKLHDWVVLDNGNNRKDSWGVLTLARNFWHKERGIPAYWQFGLLGGYGVNMFGFPEQDIFSFVLGNNDQYNGMFAMFPLEPLLEDAYQAPPVVDFDMKKTKKMSLKKLRRFEGDYWDAEGGYARRVYVKNDTLRYFRIESDYESALVPLSDTTFQMVVESDDVVMFEFRPVDEGFHLYVTPGESDPYIYEPYSPRTYEKGALNEFKGTYYNAELNTLYTFAIREGTLTAAHLRNGIIEFQPIMTDVFRGNRPYFNCIRFSREQGVIVGFETVVDGIGKLRFTKVLPDRSSS